MANITFLIGNGLDLSMNLKTTYRDFYKYVRKNNLHPNNEIYQAIEADPETWADFELALGLHTKSVDTEKPEKQAQASARIHDDLDDVIVDLANYLKTQEASINIEGTGTIFSPTGYFSELPAGQQALVKNLLKGERVIFQFVTYNYTNTLERILDNSSYEFKSANVFKATPLHLHGSVTRDLTLGVSDETQLSTKMPDTDRDDLIKPRLIKSMNDNRMITFQGIIDNSSVIVLYGLSLGSTDSYIWKIINQWMRLSESRVVIIHWHDSSYDDTVQLNSRKNKRYINTVKQKLLAHSEASPDELVELSNQILVIHNTKALILN